SEHQTILRVIDVLERLVARSERGDGFEHAAMRRCVEFFQLFADACHHAKEEDILFPVLAKRGIPREGGPIAVMLHEHTLARQFTKQMDDARGSVGDGEKNAEKTFILAALEYVELLRNHIHKEDNILFNMGDGVMSQEDQTTLCAKFCEVGCRSFGGKSREELVRIADELEQQWSA
ncbi:MAG: hemerythrin domain-containing protein, partial [Planctomycetes bacterium]|nr:hemerythrin domain-containing protein [Planctomycetota bacterium]